MDRENFYINNISKQFLCCTPINKINFTILAEHEDHSLNLELQKHILDSTVNNDLVRRYPIKTSYQKAFLKLLMQKIKESGNELHDDMYVAYCTLVSLPDKDSVHYRHFLVENGTSNYITLKESTNLISEGSTGLCSWQAAVVLSTWCAENIEQFRRKNVLELGCGVGLTGMNVVSICSPKRYIFSDYHPTVLDMLCENVKLNFLADEESQLLNTSSKTSRLKLQLRYEQTDIEIMELRWENIDEHLIKSLSQPDIIIGADILYESNSFNALATGLAYLLTSNNYAVIAVTVRNADTISYFLEQLGGRNLTFEKYILSKQTISIQSTDSPVWMLKIFQKT